MEKTTYKHQTIPPNCVRCGSTTTGKPRKLFKMWVNNNRQVQKNYVTRGSTTTPGRLRERGNITSTNNNNDSGRNTESNVSTVGNCSPHWGHDITDASWLILTFCPNLCSSQRKTTTTATTMATTRVWRTRSWTSLASVPTLTSSCSDQLNAVIKLNYKKQARAIVTEQHYLWT